MTRTHTAEHGLRSYLSGDAAEMAVMRAYIAQGAHLLQRRWRGQSGEIDLIFEDKDDIVFCEVKQATTHVAAMTRLRPAQYERIMGAAEEYLTLLPKGQLTPVRFDFATVDRQGQVRILYNALAEF